MFAAIHRSALVFSALSFIQAWPGRAFADTTSTWGSSNAMWSCQQIASKISSASAVYYPTDAEYAVDIHHYAASSMQNATCSVEPGIPEDVGTILKIVGATWTPFAGGGHIMNPGYSSTTGVQIAMSRFSQVSYDEATQTASVGAGLIWDEVYAALEPHGVNVVGGRVSGIGVAGFTLGGGYSWLTNQYGLTIDNVVEYELVLPNGLVTVVSEASDPELFFGLKGGYNNFGIVTTFTLRTRPQGQVWGGLATVVGTYLDEVNAATAHFVANVTDPKAAVIMAYEYTQGVPVVSMLFFYDGPTPPPGIFEEYLAIPVVRRNISTRSFLSLVTSFPLGTTVGYRGYCDTVPLVEITPAVLDSVVSELLHWGKALENSTVFTLSYDVELFLPDILTYGSPSAYPPTRKQRYLPLDIWFSWSDAAYDETISTALRKSVQSITKVALTEGQLDVPAAPRYPNYAIYDTELSQMYGDSLAVLARLRTTHDPTNVMGLAGGWNFEQVRCTVHDGDSHCTWC